MKKLILTAMTVFALTAMNAQDDSNGYAKSDIFISGSVSLNSTSTGDIKNSSFGVSPKIGYLVSDNIAIGLAVGFNSSTEKFPGFEDDKSTQTSFGAFGRYFFTPASKFSIYVDLAATYDSFKQEQGPAEAKASGFGVGVGPGINYFLNSNFTIELNWAALAYQSFKPDVDGADATNNIQFGVNFTDLAVGLAYKF